MTESEYLKEISAQLTTAGGILAGFSFAAFVGLAVIEKKTKFDVAVVFVFFVSSLALILATVLSGMLTFSIPLRAEHQKAVAALDSVLDVTQRVWFYGFVTLLFGMGLTGFKVGRKFGICSLVLAMGAIGVFIICVCRVGSAFEH